MEGISMKLNNFSIEFNTFVNKRYQDKKIFKYEYTTTVLKISTSINICSKNAFIKFYMRDKK